jgi:hypothetical protein
MARHRMKDTRIFATKQEITSCRPVSSGERVEFVVKERLKCAERHVEYYTMSLPTWLLIRVGWEMVKRHCAE